MTIFFEWPPWICPKTVRNNGFWICTYLLNLLMIIFMQILGDSNVLGSCTVGLSQSYIFLIWIAIKMLRTVNIWPVLAVWKMLDLSVSHTIDKILNRNMYVVGKCFRFMDKKWFFIKYILGMVLSRIPDG